MIRFILFFLIIGPQFSLNAQVETCINWIKEDCKTGIITELYDVLEDDVVVVQEYIMENCEPCITVGVVIKDILAEYEAAYPGKVVGYQTAHDDFLACEDVISWADSNGFTSTTLFDNGAAEIEYYGIMGMPTLLVLGGDDHKIFYFHLGLISSQITQKELKWAIDSALMENGVELISAINNHDLNLITISPNPASEKLFISRNSGIVVDATIYSASGNLILYKNNIIDEIDIHHLPAGTYFLKLITETNIKVEKIIIQ